MRTLSISIALLAASATGCKSVECGQGTIERNGNCAPADLTASPATCGPFTVLHGDQCAPMFPPTQCDPATTTADVDQATGVITCIGTGGGGCSAPFACPTPSGGSKQTICGQLYDLETSQPFAAPGATGAKCAAPTTSGPCAVALQAYDAVSFAMNPATATPLTNGGVYVDDCGRYRVTDIDVPGGLFIGLGLDDASAPSQGPAGVTNAVGWATPKTAGMATKDLDGWIAPSSTTTQWSSSGGPALAGGVFVGLFRAHKTGTDPQAGVTFVKPASATDFYFTPTQITRQTIDAAATATGANGTGLLAGASIADGLVYSGTGGLTDTVDCTWETHAAVSLPYIVFVQVFRPQNQTGKTCPL